MCAELLEQKTHDNALGQQATVRAEFREASTRAEDWPAQEPNPACLSSLGNNKGLRDSFCVSAEEPRAFDSFQTRTVAPDFIASGGSQPAFP